MAAGPPYLDPFDHTPSLPAGICEVCDDAIEEPRVAVGLKTCWACAPADPNSPPWVIEPHG